MEEAESCKLAGGAGRDGGRVCLADRLREILHEEDGAEAVVQLVQQHRTCQHHQHLRTFRHRQHWRGGDCSHTLQVLGLSNAATDCDQESQLQHGRADAREPVCLARV